MRYKKPSFHVWLPKPGLLGQMELITQVLRVASHHGGGWKVLSLMFAFFGFLFFTSALMLWFGFFLTAADVTWKDLFYPTWAFSKRRSVTVCQVNEASVSASYHVDRSLDAYLLLTYCSRHWVGSERNAKNRQRSRTLVHRWSHLKIHCMIAAQSFFCMFFGL